MILCIDTSTPTCHVRYATFEGIVQDFEWEAGRELAKGLLGYLEKTMQQVGTTWQDISGIVAFQGPGSFTGLRIGLTVVNTFAESESLPIVGVQGDDWREKGLERLKQGDNDKIVLPFYGAEANITKPRS